jgi:peptidoglycan/LPS O-acetylase OafA/YrhL
VATETGAEIVALSKDNSLLATEPLVAKAAVVGVVSSVLVALGAFGLVTDEQRTVIIEQVGNITYGLFVILPFAISIATALWGRLSTFAPRTAALIAIANLRKPPGAEPTLLS